MGVGKVKGGKVYNSNHHAESQITGFLMKGDERSQRKVALRKLLFYEAGVKAALARAAGVRVGSW